MAGEATHGAAAGAEHGAESAAGLPQLDPSYFPSQLFWLAVFFVILYLALDRVLLPRLGGVIATREAKIKDDVDAAAKANADAHQALAAYDSAMAQAKAEARQLMEAARSEAADTRAKQTATVEAALTERLNAAEERLAGQREQGLDAARAAAADVARDIVAKLTAPRAA